MCESNSRLRGEVDARSESAEAPPPPTPPHHAQERVEGGEKVKLL